jgi:nucleotide sugar dehydrogenase
MSQLTGISRKIEDKSAVICVIGLGYVGLPTAVNFAEHGFRVIGADMNARVVELINKGGCHLKDLDLDERVKKAVEAGKLSATTDTADATRKSDAILIIVPTPVTPDKRPDLVPVEAAGRDIARGLGKGKLIVLESTVYPGVTEDVLGPVLETTGLKRGIDFGLAHCPERYNPGDSKHTIADVVRVVGAITPDWCETTVKLYRNIVKDVYPVKDIKTAEAAKVIENIQRDLNIALMNELALIFERMDIDVMDVIKAAATKWNFNVYYPGAGVGGHCLPVDPYYLVKKAEELGYHSKVITAGRSINDFMPVHVSELLVDALNECEKSVKGSKIVVLGFSYKENVGDPRETPVEILVEELHKKHADLCLVDPFISPEYLKRFGNVASDAMTALKGADALVLMTAHDEFRNLDFAAVKKMMRTPIVVDGRRIYELHKLIGMGFIYRGVGAANKSARGSSINEVH